MNCWNCGKELEDDAKYCDNCGKYIIVKRNLGSNSKANENEQKNLLKIPLKKIIIIVSSLILFIIILVILSSVNKTSISNTFNPITKAEQADVKETYTKNKYGLYRSTQIIDEQFNDHGDLTYCKYYQGNTLYEDKFQYTYDNGRLKKIFCMNDKGYMYSLEISYENNNKIKSITYYTDYLTSSLTTTYNYNYFDNYICVEKNSIASISPEMSTSYYYIYDKSINGKEYRMVLYKSKYINQVASQNYSSVQTINSSKSNYIIYEKTENEYNNSLLMLGIIPIQYWNIMHRYTSNMFSNETGFTGFEPDNINCKKIIFEEKENKEYTYTVYSSIYREPTINKNETSQKKYLYAYDNNGRLLFNREIKDSDTILSTFAYKYKQEDYGYSATQLLYYGDQAAALAIGFPKGYSGAEDEYRFYQDDNGEVYKIEKIGNTKYYTFTEAAKLYETAYASTVSNNSEDELDIEKEMLKGFNALEIGGSTEDTNSSNIETTTKEQINSNNDEIKHNGQTQIGQTNLDTENLEQSKDSYTNVETNQQVNTQIDSKEEELKRPTITIGNTEKETTKDSITLNYTAKSEYDGLLKVTIRNCWENVDTKEIQGKTYTGTCIIPLEFGENNIDVSVEDSKGQTETAYYTINMNRQPPTVTIENTEKETTKDSITLNYVVKEEYDGPMTITIRKWWEEIDTKEVQGKTYAGTCTIPLEIGENFIDVTVRDSKGQTETKNYTITKVLREKLDLESIIFFGTYLRNSKSHDLLFLHYIVYIDSRNNKGLTCDLIAKSHAHKQLKHTKL